MTDDEEWSECPECGREVKYKNLSRHLHKFHEMSMPHIKELMSEMDRDKKRASGKGDRDPAGGRKLAIGAVAVVVMVIVAAAAWTFIFQKDDEEDGNGGNGNGPPPDPNRVEFVTDDGFTIVGSYKGAKADVINVSQNYRPTLVLVHGMKETRAIWDPYGLTDSALNWGFNVLTIDIRGHGESIYKNGKKLEISSFSQDDITNMPMDVRAAVKYVLDNYQTNNQFVVVGASIGANAALNAAVYETYIRSLVLLSPGLNYGPGIVAYDPIYDYGPRPVFLAVGEYDSVVSQCSDLYNRALERVPGRDDVLFEIYPGVEHHGTNLLKIPEFNTDLEDWLKSTMLS